MFLIVTLEPQKNYGGIIVKLSADIIYEHLAEQIKVERFGPESGELTLKSVLFYEEGMILESGQIYLIQRGSFALTQPEPQGCLIIYIGGSSPKAAAGSRHGFLVTEALETAHLFNMIQAIFRRYNDWDETLSNILHDDADIKKMVLCSAGIFENPITVTNHNLEVLGAVGYSEEVENHWFLYDYKSIPFEYAGRLHNAFGQYNQIKEPYLHDDNGHEMVYSVNLFIHNKYRGCVSVSKLCRPFRNRDYTLFQYFAQYVKKALYGQLRNSRSSYAFIKSDLHALLNKAHIDESRLINALKDLAFIINDPQFSWVCIVIRANDESEFMSLEYYISSLEEKLPACIALPYKNDILLIMQLPLLDEALAAALDKIVPALKTVGLSIGVSDRFERIQNLRAAYRKACCAIETAAALGEHDKVYHYADYVLSYMLTRVTGEFQLADILPPGLSSLLRHDESSNVCYIETLRCYLANQMNTAKAARELYLHRTSLVQRLERIFEILGTRLQGADERLLYSILLHMLEQNGDISR